MKKTKVSSLIIISAATFVCSIFLGYLGYSIIGGGSDLRRDLHSPAPLPASGTASDVVLPVDAITNEFPANDGNNIAAEFFIVRENDGRIGVFVNHNGEEQFLYNIDRLVRFLPEADQALLRQGIVLNTREELTMFEEDFGS